MRLLQPLLPHHVQERLLIFELAQRLQTCVHIVAPRQQCVGEHRPQCRLCRIARRAEPFAGECARGSGDRAHRARGHRLDRREFRTRVDAHLVHFLRAARFGQHHLGGELAAGHFDPAQAVALPVVRDLEHARAEFGGIVRFAREIRKAFQKLADALHFECRAEIHRHNRAVGDHAAHGAHVNGACLEVFVHRGLALHRERVELIARQPIHRSSEVDARVRTARVQLVEDARAAGARRIHLVDEHEHRHMVTLQQPPQRECMALHAVGCRHHKDRVVERLQCALGFGGEIDVAWGVEDCELHIAHAHHRRLSVDGDTARAFDRVGV